MTEFVCHLEEAEADSGLLGGKGAGLVRLFGFEHRVPAGFVVTVNVFLRTLEQMGLKSAWSQLARSVESGHPRSDLAEEIRTTIAGHQLSERINGMIIRSAEDLLLGSSRRDLIVRSSATVEDSDRFSFAGIFESFPVSGPIHLEHAIREVWTSLLTPRALSYIRDSGLRVMPSMAVVVQRLLSPERSGVMFTSYGSPDGSSGVLIEHVEGTSEKLVKGEVTPERLWLERDRPTQGDPNRLLEAGHVAELARLADRLEGEFGGPQDVEWCVEEGLLYLVQTRPITAPVQGSATEHVVDIEPVLRGLGASPGVGHGEAHLVFNIDHALNLKTGQVLVTPMTNPDMVVAMRRAAAIVTDVGGIICHAAIVSRELGLPCVVGTETATRTLTLGESVTVDGSAGAIYRGITELAQATDGRRLAEAEDIWCAWLTSAAGRQGLTPIVSTLALLEAMPKGVARGAMVVLDLDLRCDRFGLWNDLEAISSLDRDAMLTRHLQRISAAGDAAGLDSLWLLPLEPMSMLDLDGAIRQVGDPRLVLHGQDPDAPTLLLDPAPADLRDGVAVPLATAVLADARPDPRRDLPRVSQAIDSAVDTLKFFGHRPEIRVGSMPSPTFRSRWWRLLPEYGRYHQEFNTSDESGEFEWLEVRPELVISALLKSLVQPGFEMVPRVMGFRDLPPMHIKWIRCRYHFRADTFAPVWEAIVRSTWSEPFMVDLLRRIRRSYEQLAEVLVLFPPREEDLRDLSGREMVALITSWWPRWVEFFALCWFIQAQGDDILYPFLEETVRANLGAVRPEDQVAWFPATDLIAPTTPVMSAEYMADVGRLRDELLARNLTSAEQAEAALAGGGHPDLERVIADHLSNWHWMRDRDLLFEPWDTPRRVVETALETEPHTTVQYDSNLRRNLLALSFHMDLAHASGRGEAVHHAGRFLHDLNVERENHHILWLKYSYPVRRLFLEIERRLAEMGSLTPGDVFFFQAPELIDAAAHLPAPLPEDLVARIRNRRIGFLKEARLTEPGPEPETEDDYY